MKSNMWYMRQKEEFGEDRSQGIRFYDNTQTCDYLPHWHMPYEVIMVIAEDLTVIVENMANATLKLFHKDFIDQFLFFIVYQSCQIDYLQRLLQVSADL